MSGGLYARLKTWVQDEKLKYTDLNNEFDNVINNAYAAKFGGASDTLAQMQATENPGGLGSEVTGTSISIADELERQRFVLSRVLGGAKNWYEAPTTDLTILSTYLNSANQGELNRVISGRSNTYAQPMFLQAGGTSSRTAKLLGAVTPLQYVVAGSTATLSTDITSAAVAAPAASGNTAVAVGYTENDAQNWDKFIQVGSTGASISALIGKFAAFKVGTEYFTAFVQSSTLLTSVVRGNLFSPTDSELVPLVHGINEVITLMRLSWVFLTQAGTLETTDVNPIYSGTAPAAPGAGDMWFDSSVGNWKKYSGSAWALSTSILVGYIVCDATDCVAARSIDFAKAYSSVNSINTELFTVDSYVSSGEGYQVNVYGKTFVTPTGKITWNTTNLDTGSVAGSGIYFMYVDASGSPWLSLSEPLDRRGDLGGFYHPHRPWRGIGWIIRNTANSTFLSSSFCYKNIRPIEPQAALGAECANTSVNASYAPVMTAGIFLRGSDGTPFANYSAPYNLTAVAQRAVKVTLVPTTSSLATPAEIHIMNGGGGLKVTAVDENGAYGGTFETDFNAQVQYGSISVVFPIANIACGSLIFTVSIKGNAVLPSTIRGYSLLLEEI